MSGKFNAANSDYNKDATFASFTVDETCKVTLSEAIAKDSHENYITVYGFVELPLVGVEVMGKMGWVYEPTLCKFQIPKKDYTNEYQGKKKEYKQSPGMKAAIHLITEHGFDKPFIGMFDFGVAEAVANTVITGLAPNGQPETDQGKAMLSQYFMRLEPLEKLDKLEGKEIKEYSKGGGYGGGAKGQTEAQKLADRLAFLKSLIDGNDVFDAITTSIDGEDAAKTKERTIRSLISNLFN